MFHPSRTFWRLLAFSALLLISGGLSRTARAAAPSTLYSFGAAGGTAVSVTGSSPLGLTAGPGGVFYGLTQSDGANGDGTVFEYQAGGAATALHAFGSSDGSAGSLTVSAEGPLYGTEPNGGANSSGAVFSMAADGTGFTTLYSFSAADGSGVNPDGVSPTGSLLEGSGGVWYGETQFGGPAAEGGVFKVNSDGSGFTVLHSFGATAADGAYPAGGLTLGPNGFLYGVTSFGGSANSGTVFKLKPDGSGYTVLYQFSEEDASLINADGAVPAAALTLGTDGLFYGVTVVGGSGGSGVVFRIAADGSGFSVLHAFSAVSSQNSDGGFPISALVTDTAGDFYGTTVSGGSAGQGTLYRVSAGGSQFTALYAFQSGDGTDPALAAGSDGQIYGTTLDGGANASGSIFRLVLTSATHILWDNANGAASIWNYGTTAGTYSQNSYGPFSGWTAKAIADGGTDGQTRVLWDNANGQASIWSLDNATGIYSQFSFGPFAGWTAKTLSVGLSGMTHILWTNRSGTASLWNYTAANGSYTHREYGPFPGWTAAAVADGPDDLTRVLWVNTNGQMSLWSLDSLSGLYTQNSYGPFANWTAKGVSVGADNTTHVLWDRTDGAASLWNYSSSTGSYTHQEYGPYSGWTAKGVADGSDGMSRVLWNNASGQMSLWSLDNTTGIYSQFSFGPYSGWTAQSTSAGP